MNVVLIGAGKMARGVVYDLLKNPNLETLYIIDQSLHALGLLKDKFNDKRIEYENISADDKAALAPIFEACDGALSAVPYDYNLGFSELAIEEKTHLVDLGGNNNVVKKQFALHDKAKNAGIAIVPDCGLAPGMVSIIGAHAVEGLTHIDSLELRVGGLPLHPKPPLNYSVAFSVHGLINEYKEDALILEQGREKCVPSLTGIETLYFPSPFDEMEAFYTSGGVSTLTKSFRGKIRNLDYKTIRYPGHGQLMKAFADLGFMDEEKLEPQNNALTKREVFEELLSASLQHNAEDVVLIRITSRGTALDGIKRIRQYQAIEYGEQSSGLSAMMRTTAFSASVILQMLLEGKITEYGTLYQELSIPADEYIIELKKRNIHFEITENS